MNKLIIALIAGTFAAVASAQAPSSKTKMKQEEVKAATQGGVDSTAQEMRDQKGVAEAKAMKGTPKALPTKADKQKAAASATSGAVDANAQAARDQAGVAAAKASKGTPKALPTKADKQKAVAGTTGEAVKKDGSN